MRLRGIVQLTTAAVLLELAAAAPARAQTADERFQRGVRLYDAGDYDAAAREFAKAHKLDPKPDYLFAWAQAKRREGDCKTAHVLFERFLQVAPTKVAAEAAKKAISDGCVEKPPEPVEEHVASAADAPTAKVQVFTPEDGEKKPTSSVRAAAARAAPHLFAAAGRVDLAPLNRGAMIAPGLILSLGKAEIFVNALFGGQRGGEGGFRATPFKINKWLTPYASVSLPIINAGGPRLCTRGSLGARVHLGSGWAVTAEGGGAFNFNPPPPTQNPDGSVREFSPWTGLVSLGVEVWY